MNTLLRILGLVLMIVSFTLGVSVFLKKEALPNWIQNIYLKIIFLVICAGIFVIGILLIFKIIGKV